jgi:cytochrome c oxidase cbb3-type subunit 3
MTDRPERDPVTGGLTTGHEWDGIHELNTPLPKWSVYTFIVTILFAIGYCILFPAIPFLHDHTVGLLWAACSGQYEDLDGAAGRILFDDPPPGPPPTKGRQP